MAKGRALTPEKKAMETMKDRAEEQVKGVVNDMLAYADARIAMKQAREQAEAIGEVFELDINETVRQLETEGFLQPALPAIKKPDEPQEKDTTYQTNVLIAKRTAWTAKETKVFYLALKKIRPQLHESFTDYTKELSFTWTPAEIVKSFGSDWIRKDMEKICSGLMDKGKFKIPTANGWKMIRLFTLIEWDNQTGLRMEFCKYMNEYLVDLVGKHYTKIQFSSVFSLSSAHAMRLLELGLTFINQKIKKRTFDYDMLREYFGIDKDTYKRLWNFEQRVLTGAIDEINKKTPYRMAYQITRITKGLYAIELSIALKQKEINGIFYDTANEKTEKEIAEVMESLRKLDNIQSANTNDKAIMLELLIKKKGPELVKMAQDRLKAKEPKKRKARKAKPEEEIPLESEEAE